MSFITNNLFQDITKWTAGAKDRYGAPTWSAPVTIKGRWEDKQVKTTNFQGNDIISNSIVYVDVDLSFGDYIYLGISTATSPPAAAKEVRNFSKIPSLKNKFFQRKAIL